MAVRTTSMSTRVFLQGPCGRSLGMAMTRLGATARIPSASSFSQATAMTALTLGLRTAARAWCPPEARWQRIPIASLPVVLCDLLGLSRPLRYILLFSGGAAQFRTSFRVPCKFPMQCRKSSVDSVRGNASLFLIRGICAVCVNISSPTLTPVSCIAMIPA
jgi:hypothetical protein